MGEKTTKTHRKKEINKHKNLWGRATPKCSRTSTHGRFFRLIWMRKNEVLHTTWKNNYKGQTKKKKSFKFEKTRFLKAWRALSASASILLPFVDFCLFVCRLGNASFRRQQVRNPELAAVFLPANANRANSTYSSIISFLIRTFYFTFWYFFPPVFHIFILPHARASARVGLRLRKLVWEIAHPCRSARCCLARRKSLRRASLHPHPALALIFIRGYIRCLRKLPPV